jgi:DNA polymerase elongation subunit (family B)
MRFYTDVNIHRGRIQHSGYDNGKKFINSTNFMPNLAIESQEETGMKTLQGSNAKMIGFDSIREFKDYKKNYADTIGFHNSINPIYQFLAETYPTEVKFDTREIRTLIYDIETIDSTETFKGFPQPHDAPVPVVSIAIKDLKSNVYWLLSLEDYEPNYNIAELDAKKVIHRKCNNEFALLHKFCEIIEKLQPDLLVGYNNKGFDDPYILHRIDKICGEDALKKLSPCGQVHYEFKLNKFGKMECKYQIKGLQILDYLELYKKFIPAGRESYSLSFISKYELGDDKLDYSEHENITRFYIEDPLNFLFYNIKDVELIHLLDKKLGLLDLIYTVAYMAKINYEDVMSPIRTWDSIIYEYLKAKNIVVPPEKHEKRESYPGAYVHEPKTGIYDWVVSFDLASLYPHEIMQFNISSETLVTEKMIDEDIKKIDKEIKYLNSLL